MEKHSSLDYRRKLVRTQACANGGVRRQQRVQLVAAANREPSAQAREAGHEVGAEMCGVARWPGAECASARGGRAGHEVGAEMCGVARVLHECRSRLGKARADGGETADGLGRVGACYNVVNRGGCELIVFACRAPSSSSPRASVRLQRWRQRYLIHFFP